MSTAPDMTVVEFATMHADECNCGTERTEHIRTHVDLLIETAVMHSKHLWRVGVDSEGRVSLIWLSQPEAEWHRLMAQAAEIIVLKSAFGLN
jgi:hypothetical protein